MLNLSENSVHHKIDQSKFSSFKKVNTRASGKLVLKLLGYSFLALLVILFLPWTQNVRADGNVTALRPDQRPQTIHSVIAGRIEKWFVQEGDFVKRGDTIIYISETKDEYFDPNLLARTEEQVKAKEMAVGAYGNKVRALDNQISALEETAGLKLEQAQNRLQQSRLRVIADSVDYLAALANYSIAEEQLERTQQLYDRGLKSLTDLETRKLNLQRAQAAMISAENRLLSARNEVLNARVELTSIQAQYRDDIAKAQSEKYTALSGMYDAEATVTKLHSQFMNYSVRAGMYYITAPQDGYITKAIQTGIGETIKEGTPVISIMPANPALAVEMFIRPIDLPLIERGQDVRIQFDGWPAIVFSGWPNTSVGTYGGEVIAIDNFISENGMYRILVVPDPEEHPWPDALRVGAGTDNMLLLKDVPIWYELWRKINGFPPDYYKSSQTKTGKSKEVK